MENISTEDRNKHTRVEKSCWTAIRIRFETLFNQFGTTRAKLTEFLDWDKARTSRIVNGIEIPNIPTRVKIASFFKNGDKIPIDTSVIWENPDIIFTEQDAQKELNEVLGKEQIENEN